MDAICELRGVSMTYPAAQIAELARLRETGMPNKAICASMGITNGRLANMIVVHDLRRRTVKCNGERWSAADIDRLDRLLGEGETFERAARIMGRTKNSAVGAAHRHLARGLPPRPQRPVLEFPPPGFCLWLQGDMLAGTGSFPCSAHVQSGSAYCSEHHARVYQRAPKPEAA